MGSTAELWYGHASRRLVSEILHYVQRFDDGRSPAPGPAFALKRATEAARLLETAAREGADLDAAYAAAAGALEEAAEALARVEAPSFAASRCVAGPMAYARRRAAQGA